MSRQTAIQKTTTNAIEVNSPQPVQAAVTDDSQAWSYIPPMDVLESKHEYTIVCDAPGIVPNEIDLTYDRGVVRLHGPVVSRYSQQAKFLRQEYGVGDFDRSIPLGRLAEFIDGDRVNATYEGGVLTVHLPKLAGALGKRIQVHAV